MLPVLTGFVAVLTAFSVHDLLANEVSASRIATHGPLAAGLVLLLWCTASPRTTAVQVRDTRMCSPTRPRLPLPATRPLLRTSYRTAVRRCGQPAAAIGPPEDHRPLVVVNSTTTFVQD